MSVHVFMINTNRNLYCLYLYPLCKLATAIIAKGFFFNISESMHDEIKKTVYIAKRFFFNISDEIKKPVY